jgi:hypothetical protein
VRGIEGAEEMGIKSFTFHGVKIGELGRWGVGELGEVDFWWEVSFQLSF